MAKFPRLITLPVAAMLILSACGGGATPTPGSSGTPASNPPASTGTGASTEPGGSAVTGGSITVTSLWGGSEQENFQKVLDAFKAATGITANYESIRTDYPTVLQTRISGGNPPDVSILPGIGFLRHFAKDGSIKKLSDVGIDASSIAGIQCEDFIGIADVHDSVVDQRRGLQFLRCIHVIGPLGYHRTSIHSGNLLERTVPLGAVVPAVGEPVFAGPFADVFEFYLRGK